MFCKQSRGWWFGTPSCPLPSLNSFRPSVACLCLDNLSINVSDNGLSLGKRQAIIWTNAGMLIRPWGTNFSEILIEEIHIFSFKKMHLKMTSGKWWPICLGPNVLTMSTRSMREVYTQTPDTIKWSPLTVVKSFALTWTKTCKSWDHHRGTGNSAAGPWVISSMLRAPARRCKQDAH